jgi:hypothetical protein
MATFYLLSILDRERTTNFENGFVERLAMVAEARRERMQGAEGDEETDRGDTTHMLSHSARRQ